ncbi:hypothetical protein R1sor_026264 [Riccia sorocarpa]|uniref:Uncharacterized protein n=1 Tax=Riccia sorocarpa TaxID=122646 RepID=A0ABD3GEK2_9MARC
MAPTFVGKVLPYVKLMEKGFLQQYNLDYHHFLRKTVQFVPYSFKDLANVDCLEFSALTALKLVNYISGIQRLCVTDDVFWWALLNTDLESDRILIRGEDGVTCVIGWHEIQVAFRTLHDERDEFRKEKIAHKQFVALKPGQFLLEIVETNVNKKLVSGQPYEEINYYKKAAPYGPTYYSMTVICELFWCNARSPRFSSPMILYAFRETIFKGTNLAESEGWLGWSHMSRDGDIDHRQLISKFPTMITNLGEIRNGCRLPDDIPLASPVRSPVGVKVVGRLVRKRQRQPEVTPKSSKPRMQPPTSRIGPRTRVTSRWPVSEAGPSVPPDTIISIADDSDSPSISESLGKVKSELDSIGSELGQTLRHLLTERLEAYVSPLQDAADAVEHAETFLKSQVINLHQELEKVNKDVAEGQDGDLNFSSAIRRAYQSRPTAPSYEFTASFRESQGGGR